MNDDLWELARNCYGYGSWDADYWFIGPEQGGSLKELAKRAVAFRKLNKDGLCDCREFHKEIYEVGEKDWFRLTPLPPLQPTWHCSMLTLMSYLGKVEIEKPTKGKALNIYQIPFREYQRDHWGSSFGKTCVIELSGIPAKNFKESSSWRAMLSQTERDELDDIRRCRAEHIASRIREAKPEIVVVYSKSQYSDWEALRKQSSRISHGPNEIFRLNQTLITFTESTGQNAPGHARWLALGEDLKRHRSTTFRN